MKAKPFKAVPAPTLENRSPENRIKRGELVALLASRVQRGRGDDETTVRNRMSSGVDYAVKTGRLKPTARGFALGDIAFWASSCWPGCFDDVPKYEGVGFAEFPLMSISVTGSVRQLPRTLEEAHREIITLTGQLQDLQRKLEEERARVRELETDAEKWRTWNWNKGRRKTV